MPIFIVGSNYERVARSHLLPGESMELWMGGMRGVVALTDRRLLVSDFPWFGPARLIFEAPLAGVSGVGVASGADGCEVWATVGPLTRRAVLPSFNQASLQYVLERLTPRIAASGGRLAVSEGDRLQAVSNIACDGCGASVAVQDPAASHAVCGYCRRAQPVPDWAREALGIDEQLAALLLQARAELTATLYQRSNAPAIYEVVGAFLGMGTGFALGGLIGTVAPHALAIVAGLVLAIVCAFLFVLPFHMVAERIARAQAARLARQLDARRQHARCVTCGAPVQVPGGVARLHCGHCRTPLIASDGLIARWTGDAQALIGSWRTQASALLAETGGMSLGLWLTVGLATLLVVSPVGATLVYLLSRRR